MEKIEIFIEVKSEAIAKLPRIKASFLGVRAR